VPVTEIDLQQTNCKIQHMLELLSQEDVFANVSSVDLSDLSADLRRAGESLRINPEQDSKAEMNAAISDYRRNLEALQKMLPGFYNRLQIERARLQRDRVHLAVAAQWAGTNEETL
jgi:hypothetical protein